MSLKFKNGSMFPTSIARALACFALCAVDVFDYVPQISVFDCKDSPFRGQCHRGTRECIVEIGHPTLFYKPVVCHYRKRAPQYFLLNWQEALVAVSAHEGTHARQFASGRRLSEVECEHAALAAVTLYREKQYEFDGSYGYRSREENELDTLLSLPIESEEVTRG